ncbi:NAD-dependent epimerase/dehydratase family protein, partial [Candidatus Gottesmanbacteria bacterium]|nr:NAD-dependent epimerase/dehydratase family protein [Candidatus Gottesmanbacteria bacterium]
GYPFQQDVSKMIKANIIFSSLLLETAKEINLKAFIITGSSSEYGYKNKPMKETDTLDPASFYAATKAATTNLALVYARSYNLPVIIVRPFSVYGPYEEPTRLVPTVIMKCLKNEDVELTKGMEKRDFIYIEDFLDCFMKLSKNPGKITGHIINIGSGKQFSTRDIAKLIQSLTKSHSRLLWGKYPNRKWDAKFWLADINLAKRSIGWQPKRDLPKGISETITWFKKNLNLYER